MQRLRELEDARGLREKAKIGGFELEPEVSVTAVMLGLNRPTEDTLVVDEEELAGGDAMRVKTHTTKQERVQMAKAGSAEAEEAAGIPHGSKAKRRQMEREERKMTSNAEKIKKKKQFGAIQAKERRKKREKERRRIASGKGSIKKKQFGQFKKY